MKLILTFLSVVLLLQISNAQDEPIKNWEKKLKSFKLKPVVGLQIWSTYTVGQEIYDNQTGGYEKVDDRWNTQIHRSRFGITGQPYEQLKFAVITSLDFVGRDVLSGTVGGANNGASPEFRIWNAYLQWKISKKQDAFHLTVGYMTPQFSRESVNPAFRVSSMEKSWSQNYMRRQLIGTGPGRAMGINLGGLFLNDEKSFGLGYDASVFNPAFREAGGNSTGEKYAPVFFTRVVLYVGDPEFEKYTFSRKVNYFGKRKGLSVGLSAARQGETNIFKSNAASGFDFLFNWENFNLDGEWTFLSKDGTDISNGVVTDEFTIGSNTGYLRTSFNIHLKKDKVLEPVFMLVQFNGTTSVSEQRDAQSVGAFAGKDYSYEAGLNYYFNPDLKLSLHYTWRSGEKGDADDGVDFNNYYFQSGAGEIRRGDWLGLGLVAIF